MIELRLSDIAELVGGQMTGPDLAMDSLGTDSRALTAGALFVALRDQRDGHDFLDAAVQAGAGAVMVQSAEGIPKGISAVVVGDTWKALSALALAVRIKVAPRVIAVTGSVGKTTTKDLIAAACGGSRKTVASKDSHNNELGVPLTLLAIDAATEVLVVEVGARGVGHIESLMPLVLPDVAVVTAVGGGAHLEQFGTLASVAQAKSELVQGLRTGGVAVLNADDPAVSAMAEHAPGRVLKFSAAGNVAADLHARVVRLDGRARASFVAVTPAGRVNVTLPLAGIHHVGNALAALAAAISVGVPIESAAAALGSAKVSAARSEVIEVAGVRIINDAYNANPTSTLAALDALAAQDIPGRRWAVLGLMAELGAQHADGHREVGRRAAQVADVLMVVGDGAGGIVDGAHEVGGVDILVAPSVEGAMAALALRSGDALLVKASRVVGLDRIVASLDRRSTQ